MSTKIMIVGRSGSGKDTVASYLTNKYGLKQLCSTTTRPRRYPGEDTHIFVSEDEANTMTDRVAETVINGYQYFATRQQLEECDVYVIDPAGLKYMIEKAPDVPICIAYIDANEETRMNRALSRAADPLKEKDVFLKRQESENEQFSNFENNMNLLTVDELKKIYPSANVFCVFENNEKDKSIAEKFADKIVELRESAVTFYHG